MAANSALELLTRNSAAHHQVFVASQTAGPLQSRDSEVLEGSSLAPDPSQDISHSLPPVDGGRQAWLFLTACFFLEGIVWGLPFSFGVFQVYYTTHEPFAGQSPSTIAAIGSTVTGVAYFSAPFFSIAMQRWPRSRRPGMVVGLAVMAIALVSASFCDTVNGLLATQGVLYALGCIVLYLPSNLFLDEWFNKRKSLAFGIMWAGTGASGAAAPFILEWLLNTYGFRTTMRAWAAAMIILTIPCLFFVKPRLPLTAANAFRPQDLKFMKTRSFWLFQTGNIANSLGCFVPSLWMPAFAKQIGLPTFVGPLSLAFYNGGYSAGAVAFGLVSDRFHVSVAILMTTVLGMLSALIVWGLASTEAMLLSFAILWGIASGGFNATWAGCAGAVRRKEPGTNIDTGIFLGMMAAGKGIGSVVSGPLSEKLLGFGWNNGGHFAYGTSYGVLVVFCGVSAAFGGTACIGRLLKVI